MAYGDYYVARALAGWAPLELVHAAPEPEPGSLQALEEVTELARGVDVCSFDVFDTLLRRDVEPPGLPQRAALRLLLDLLAGRGVEATLDDLAARREVAEGRARSAALARGDDPECTLTEVFAELLGALAAGPGGPPPDLVAASTLAEVEVEAEARRLSAMPGAVGTLAALRAAGKRVVLVSDMYLEHAHLHRLLRGCGLAEHVDELEVSSRARRSKGSGRLFADLVARGVLRPGRTLHVGDHPVADVQRPREHGLAARLFQPRAELARRARLDAVRRAATQLGELRLLTPRDPAVDPGDAGGAVDAAAAPGGAYVVGRDHLAPAFALFARAVFQRAVRGGYREVLFLARDGYLFHRLFERLRARAPAALRAAVPPARYVHLSRSLVTFAAFEDPARDVLERLDPTLRRLGVAPLLAALGLDPAAFAPWLAAQPATGELGSDALRALLRDDGFCEALRQAHQRQHRLLEDYAAQHGVLGAGRLLLVDIGWTGTIPEALERALGGRGDYPDVDVAFFGLERSRDRVLPRTRFLDGFAYDAARRNPVEALVNQARELVELVAAPTAGSVVEYVREPDGRVRPRLGPVERDDATARLVAALQDGIEAGAERLGDAVERFELDDEALRADAIIALARVATGRVPEAQGLFDGVEFNLGWGRENRVRLRDVLGFARAAAGAPPPTAADARTFRLEVGGAGGGDPRRVIEKLVAVIDRLRAEPRFIVYGAGTVATVVAPSLIDRIECFVDSNRGLEGRSFLGRPVVGLDYLAGARGKTVFVTPLRRKAVLAPVLAPYGVEAIYVDDLL